MSHFTSVEFKTLDGLTLRGCLYSANAKGPGVILTPGLACVKEMFIPEIAEAFQASGITALTYDPRSFGESEGLPRQQVDPLAQASDYSDAFTFLSQQPLVDHRNISFWGFSFAGMVALTASALDRRASHCISICPLTNFSFSQREKVLARIMQDRESQLAGNAPLRIPFSTPNGESLVGFGGGEPVKEDYEYILKAQKVAERYRNSTTLQSYHKIMMWNPWEFAKMVRGMPCLVVTGKEDRVSQLGDQGRLVGLIEGSKKWVVEEGKGHMDIFLGESLERLVKVQVDFLMDRE